MVNMNRIRIANIILYKKNMKFENEILLKYVKKVKSSHQAKSEDMAGTTSEENYKCCTKLGQYGT